MRRFRNRRIDNKALVDNQYTIFLQRIHCVTGKPTHFITGGRNKKDAIVLFCEMVRSLRCILAVNELVLHIHGHAVH